LTSIPVFPEDCQRDLYEHYEVSPEIIGKGSFGFVRRVKLITDHNIGSESDNDSDDVGEGNVSVIRGANDEIESLPRNIAYERYCACKTIPKSNLDDRELFVREVYNLNRCQATDATRSNGVIRLLDVIEDRSFIHIITEICEGGELYEYIVREHGRTGRGLRGKALSPSSSYNDDGDDDGNDELRCANIIFQILTAFKIIHEDARVCHRDMKASNFMFVRKPSFLPNSLDLRVIDFGLSKYVGRERERMVHPDSDLYEKKNKEENSTISVPHDTPHDHDKVYSKRCHYMTSAVGAPYYVAPEVLVQGKEDHFAEQSSISSIANDASNNNDHHNDNLVGYSTKCDIWSIGVLAFLTLTGKLPIMGRDEAETVEMIMDPDTEVDFSDDTLWGRCDADGDDHNGKEDDLTKGRKKNKKTISLAAQTFCRALLQRDPKKRPTAREALRFEWIIKHCGDVR